MFPEGAQSFFINALGFMSALFIFVIGIGVLVIIGMYIADVTQKKQAIRRNYPVVGRFRYWFEHLGEFFRQYFFAMDREELPLNRAERSWGYRAAKDLDNTVAFGSTRDLRPPGTILFVNCPFPTLGEDAVPPRRGIEHAPDFITVDGADDGTGPAPMSLIDDMGLPLRESLPMVVDKLREYDLQDRVKLVASGKLITPTEVAWALCMGADFVASARGNMFALGCIQALQCNKNTCPTGIATHDPELQRGLVPEEKAIRVAHYIKNVVKEVGIIAHSCGVTEPRQLRRYHARMVIDNSKSIPLDELWPEVKQTENAA